MAPKAAERARGLSVWFVVPALVFIDLCVKVWARSLLAETPLEFADAFLKFRLVENTGVSIRALDFGVGAGQLALVVLTIAVVAAVGTWMMRTKSEWQRLFVGLIFAGGLSNVVDRLLYGGVTDFIEYRWFGQPLFIGNLADIWIFLGVLGAFLPLLFSKRRGVSPATQATGTYK